MRIEYLADHPELIPILAEWHHLQWHHYNPGDTVVRRAGRMQAHLDRRQVPLTFVALDGETLLGSAALEVFDMHDRTDLTPWLASVYVAPAHRRQGVGNALVQQVVTKARALGIDILYLFTPDQEAWYAKMGWKVLERTEYMGHSAVIMSLSLSLDAAAPE